MVLDCWISLAEGVEVLGHEVLQEFPAGDPLLALLLEGTANLLTVDAGQLTVYRFNLLGVVVAEVAGEDGLVGLALEAVDCPLDQVDHFQGLLGQLLT